MNTKQQTARHAVPDVTPRATEFDEPRAIDAYLSGLRLPNHAAEAAGT